MAGRWRTKSVEQSIADTDEPGTRLRKELTWVDLAVFGVAVVIGAGIFTVTASTTGDITGPAIWISFVIAAVTCALAALCYAEFASTLPVAGSAYTFSYATFGEFIAWIIGWNLLLELAVGAAVVSKGWSSYLGTVFGFAGGTVNLGGIELDWGALLIVAAVSILIAFGTKLSSRFSQVITAIKVSVVVLVVVVGAFYIKSANYSPFIPAPEAGGDATGINQSVLSLLTGAHSSHYGWYGVLAGASIVFFAFIGFDIVATMAEETKNPQRNVPRGILASLAIVTVLYVAVSVVLSGMVSYTQLKTDPGRGSANLATAFTANGVTWASKIIAVGALAGLTTVVMVLMLGQCRVLFAMARDGLLPRTLAQTGSRGTPVRITVLVAVVVGGDGVGVPDQQARGDGQRRDAVRVRPRVGRCRRAAAEQAGPGAGVPGPGGAVASDRVDLRVCLADGQPHRVDLGAVRRVAGGGNRDLSGLRDAALGAGPATGGPRGPGGPRGSDRAHRDI